ncbi:MAG: winged helix-turn-helix domain-containing protein [Terracidiphilus sp.]
MDSSADQKTRQLYGFGPFRVDPERELLLREDEAVPIAPKAFQVLLVLMRHSKQVVTKDDLLKTIWPDTFVEEANLSRNIFLLRKALGETPQDHQYIVTVPGRGYRFADDVQLVPERELNIVAATHAKVQVQVEETRSWPWIAVAAVLVVAIGVVSFKLFNHHAPVLSERDTIVLADFTNSTADPIFDRTLRQGLAIQLEQSPFLVIMDDEQVQRALRLMSRPEDAGITNAIAREVCIREGGAATIDGAIATLGRNYVITLQAISCQDGRTLARQQVEANDKEHVLSALGTAATALRSKLGESHDSIQKFSVPVEDQVTTPSLEALQSFSEAMSVMEQGHFLDAVPFLERSVDLDPKFAAAYEYLAIAYYQAGDSAKTREYAKKAFSMIDHVSEWERDTIAAVYYANTGESDKEVSFYRSGIRNYPRFWGFHNELSESLIYLGQYEEGLREGLKAAALEPKVEPPYRRQLDAYICLDRLKEADQVADKLRKLGLGGARIHQRLLELAYVEDDRAEIARQIQWFAGKPEEYLSLGLQAAHLNHYGQRRASHDLYERAADMARRVGLPNVASDFEEADARADALSGNCKTVRRLRRPALALAICGEAAPAEKLAAANSMLFPNGTIWNEVQLPEIQAAIALNRNRPEESVELLESALPFERAFLEAAYLRGRAYLAMHRGMEAAAEFRKIADHKGINWASDWDHPNWGQYYSLSYLGMARGFALAGDSAKAKEAFQDFFALWKNADHDLPILLQAKVEYARLQ